jgi:hypothetical protein
MRDYVDGRVPKLVKEGGHESRIRALRGEQLRNRNDAKIDGGNECCCSVKRSDARQQFMRHSHDVQSTTIAKRSEGKKCQEQ